MAATVAQDNGSGGELPASPAAAIEDDESEEGAGDSFDYAALVEAQKTASCVVQQPAVAAGGSADGTAAAEGAPTVDGIGTTGAGLTKKRKQRGGAKESYKRRKRQKREEELQRAKQAGLAVPSLREALKAAAAAAAASEVELPASKAAQPAPAAPVGISNPGLPRGTASAGGSSASSFAPAPATLATSSMATDGASSLAARAAARAVASASASAGAAGRAAQAAAPARRPATYDDAEAPPQPAEDPRTAAAVTRWAKEMGRRVKVAEAVNARTVFVTNLSFKATEQDVREWLGKAGNIKEVRLSRDKSTTRPLGYGHVQFEATDVAASAVEKCDKVELHGRVMRVAHAKQGKSVQFELPEELKEDVRALMREKYEGMNISTIKDAWQKRHPGQKFNTAKFGFKNFSTAIKTIEGVVLEIHLEKTLTNLAFFQGSPAHVTFLQRKAQKAEEDRLKKEQELAEGVYDYDSCRGPETQSTPSSTAPVAQGVEVTSVQASVGAPPDKVPADASSAAWQEVPQA